MLFVLCTYLPTPVLQLPNNTVATQPEILILMAFHTFQSRFFLFWKHHQHWRLFLVMSLPLVSLGCVTEWWWWRQFNSWPNCSHIFSTQMAIITTSLLGNTFYLWPSMSWILWTPLASSQHLLHQTSPEINKKISRL